MDKTIIEKATVHFPSKGGQGVLVKGNFIMTAAHCVNCSVDSGMMMEDINPEKIVTSSGTGIMVNLLAVEPVSDIAVLGIIDSQEFPEEADKFEKFCNHTRPVKLFRKDFDLFVEYPAYIYTHLREWLTCKVEKTFPTANKLVLNPEKAIQPGTSGSPVVNDAGELIGVVSVGGLDGSIPFLRSSLPVYLYKAMQNKQGLHGFKVLI